MKLISLLGLLLLSIQCNALDTFPDGKHITSWFTNNIDININQFGKKYTITDYGVINDSSIVQTDKIQNIIDQASQSGGVIIIPEGTFMTGALFFKPGTHLHIQKNGVLKGSDDISDYPVIDTRIEGQNLKYFPAIVNADKVDGFTISGEGTINGNGLRYWKAFWLRRKFNPKCTNLDEMRPRVLFITNSNNVHVSGIHLINSPFWTSHYYKCNKLKITNLYIYAPSKPVGAPSSDAIDIDVCNEVLIKGCYMSVNDDAIALKGGKGPWADKDPNNGANSDIIIENCKFGFCHAALTCGSESIHNRNIIVRNCEVDKASRLLNLKMRPDTPQIYEYIRMENIIGNVKYFIFANPWKQFFDLKDRKDMPISLASNITMKNITLSCECFIESQKSEQYKLSNFIFENLNIKTDKPDFDKSLIHFLKWDNVIINKR